MNQALRKLIIDYYRHKFPPRSFIPGITWIRTSGKVFNHQELLSLIQAALAGWWTEGEFSQKFAHHLSRILKVKSISLTNSGSSANLLAIAALTSPLLKGRRLKPGDEIITTAAGFPTTINPIIQHGCVPVFVDVDLTTLNATPVAIKTALGPKTKAIFLAHTLGNPFAVKEIKAICRTHKLWLIEDNCDAFGSTYQGKLTGTFGDLSTFSFYPGHHLTTAEGGAVVTNNSTLANILESLRNWGRRLNTSTASLSKGKLPLDYDNRYTFYELGYNFKFTDLQASLGLAQLRKFSRFTKIRRLNFNQLFQQLQSLSNEFIFHQSTPKSSPSWFGFPLTVKPTAAFTRSQLLKYLTARRIDSRLMLAGNITKQPYFISGKFPHRIAGRLENTDTIMYHTFWLGVFPEITLPMINFIAQTISQFVIRSNKSS